MLGLLAVYALTAPGRLDPGGRVPGRARSVRRLYGALVRIDWLVPGAADAWAGANLTLLYLAVFAITVLRPWRAGPAAVLMGAMCVGVAGIALGVFLATTTSSDPVSSFVAGRLAVPVASRTPTQRCS